MGLFAIAKCYNGILTSSKVLEKIEFIRSKDLYLSGENLFTFSKLPVGIDPVAI